MHASFFCTNRYRSSEAFRHLGWPTPPPAVGLRSLETALERAKLADALGFDRVSCCEHHYTPLPQTPYAIVFAAVFRPVRIAEELTILDQPSRRGLVVLFLRGMPNEFLAYGTNPQETRGRLQEATLLIVHALTPPAVRLGGALLSLPHRGGMARTDPTATPTPVLFGQPLRVGRLRYCAPPDDPEPLVSQEESQEDGHETRSL